MRPVTMTSSEKHKDGSVRRRQPAKAMIEYDIKKEQVARELCDGRKSYRAQIVDLRPDRRKLLSKQTSVGNGRCRRSRQ